MITPDDMKEFMKLHMKELLKDNLEITTNYDSLFGTLNIVVQFDCEKVCEGSIWSSDVESLLRK